MTQSEGGNVTEERRTLAPGLYIVATPLGNLGDMTIRARDVLAAVDRVLCEDSRVTGRLLHHLGIDARLTPYHDHNAATMRPKIMDWLERGERLALVSDAGTPLISDPGYKLVADARAAGHAVVAVPGPSALTAALSIAGLPTDRVLFLGFPPSKAGARRTFADRYRDVDATLVLYESPKRLAASLADLADRLGPREAAICREMTKRFEEVKRGRLDDLAAAMDGATVKGEIVLVIAPPAVSGPTQGIDIDAALADALTRMSLREAADAVAGATGAPRRQVYQRALALKQEAGG